MYRYVSFYVQITIDRNNILTSRGAAAQESGRESIPAEKSGIDAPGNDSIKALIRGGRFAARPGAATAEVEVNRRITAAPEHPAGASRRNIVRSMKKAPGGVSAGGLSQCPVRNVC